jgi:hypothetical protein
MAEIADYRDYRYEERAGDFGINFKNLDENRKQNKSENNRKRVRRIKFDEFDNNPFTSNG